MLHLWDDTPLNNNEFGEWLDQLPEFEVKSGPNTSKSYYIILLSNATLMFEKDDWDRAQQKRLELSETQKEP